MNIEEVLRAVSTPLGDGAAYPGGPYRFFRREYLNVYYRSDPAALRRVVPEPLRLDGALVRFEIMLMPDSVGLGRYAEGGQAIRVSLDGCHGEYLHAMYVDSLPAIAAGREVSAYPKKLGKPALYVDSDTLVGSIDYGSLRIATATMGYKHRPLPRDEALAAIGVETFMLKTMRGYDSRPRICELVRTRISDIRLHEAWTGPARLQLFAHALAPMADLPVLEVLGASHLVADLSLEMPALVYDYLAPPG